MSPPPAYMVINVRSARTTLRGAVLFTLIENVEISPSQVWPKIGQNFKYLSVPISWYRRQEVNFDFSPNSICQPKIYDFIFFRSILLKSCDPWKNLGYFRPLCLSICCLWYRLNLKRANELVLQDHNCLNSPLVIRASVELGEYLADTHPLIIVRD